MKRKNLIISLIAVLALAMVCTGIAIYASSDDSSGARITDAGQAEDTSNGAKITDAGQAEDTNNGAKITDAGRAEDSDIGGKITPDDGVESAAKWKVRLDDEIAYIGYFNGTTTEFIPGTDDEQLIAEFTEMLNNLRMVEIPTDIYKAQYMEQELSIYDAYAHGEQFKLYNAEGRHIGNILFFHRYFQDAENSGVSSIWSRFLYIYVLDENGEISDSFTRFLMDEETFDTELMNRVCSACLCGMTPKQFFNAVKENANGIEPLNLKTVDVIAQYAAQHPDDFGKLVAVPVN